MVVWSQGGSPDSTNFQLVQDAAPGLNAATSPLTWGSGARQEEAVPDTGGTWQLPGAGGSGTLLVLHNPCPSTTLILSSKSSQISCNRKEIVQSLEMDEAG